MKCEFDMFILENHRIIIASMFSTRGGVYGIFMIMSEWKSLKYNQMLRDFYFLMISMRDQKRL